MIGIASVPQLSFGIHGEICLPFLERLGERAHLAAVLGHRRRLGDDKRHDPCETHGNP